METMEKAIKLAIEANYREGNLYLVGGVWRKKLTALSSPVNTSDIFLDPLFWQSLGKNLGWPTQGLSNWLQVWHRFIDWISEGKDANSFFEALLTN